MDPYEERGGTVRGLGRKPRKQRRNMIAFWASSSRGKCSGGTDDERSAGEAIEVRMDKPRMDKPKMDARLRQAA